MISVCCCAINAKWDVKTFVDLICKVNKGTRFEIILAHDNRVDDGAEETYKELQDKYEEFRYIEVPREETIEHLEWCIRLYKGDGRFREDFIELLEKNLEAYKDGRVDDRSKFLWRTTGLLYNKAVNESTGNILHVSGADFIMPLKLSDLESYVCNRMKDGRFYAKPTAVFAQISNAPLDYIKKTVNKIHILWKKGQIQEGLAVTLHRDYLYYPSELKDIYLCDFVNNNVISFDDPDFHAKAVQFNSVRARETVGIPERIIPMFHGVHVMTRQSYLELGGFSEEWYGRSFAEDKMTRKGITTHHNTGVYPELPPEFSFFWPGQGEFTPSISPYYPQNCIEIIKKNDPWWDKHPIPRANKPTYLHDGYHEVQYLHDLPKVMNAYIERETLTYTEIKGLEKYKDEQKIKQDEETK